MEERRSKMWGYTMEWDQKERMRRKEKLGREEGELGEGKGDRKKEKEKSNGLMNFQS